ncbi:MAG: hypothetical protein H6716_24595 [Polyangiaceae bacterium]|nr:hypothetical protein [Polyangiaceae bacterium]MCB9628152.1 hypothetical protein [Sandaracinaceae bacterium]
MSGIAQLWSRVKAESAVLQRRLRLLGLSEPEIEAVLEETLIRVLAAARDSDAELLPVTMYGTAVRVAVARRDGGSGLDGPQTAGGWGARAIGAREIAALGQIPFRQRVALVGVEVAGYTVEEVASALGVAPEEALVLLREGRSALATRLREQGDE